LIQQNIDRANAQLPDYASVSAWILADEPFSVGNGLWTGTGRARRQFIFDRYATQINTLYEKKTAEEA